MPHIEYLKAKCQKAPKLTQSRGQYGVGRRSRGPPETISVPCQIQVDYGFIVYGAARKSYLIKLDPIANQGLRLSRSASNVP